MNATVRTLLKRVAMGLGLVVVLAAGLAGYVYAMLPKPTGERPHLQDELFRKPATLRPVDRRFIGRTATELAAMIRTGEATSTEIVQAHLNQIRNENYRTNAFVWLFDAEALAAARQADAIVARGGPLGRLHGVPVSIKEEFWVKGKPSTVNSETFQGFVAPRNAAVVDAWQGEGAIVLGTTNVSSLLLDYQTVGDLYPRGNNPFDISRTPGGSTGGGAAAVAAGLVPLALGGDMGGSIRVPAAFCGLYGLKTTEGSMGRAFGSFPGEPGTPKYRRMAVAGPIATTVDDLDLAWQALMSRWPDGMARMRPAKPALIDYRVAWLDEWTFGNDRMVIGQATKARLAALIDALRAHGVATTHAQPDGFADLVGMHPLFSAYMAFEHTPWIIRQLIVRQYRAVDRHRYDFSEAADRMSDLDPDKFDLALAKRDALARGIDRFFEQYDLLVMPVTPGPAFPHNDESSPIVIDGQPIVYADYFKYPLVFNVSGHPALTVPLGLDEQGLPLAVQVVGPAYSEPALLAFAKLIEPLHDGFVRPPSMESGPGRRARR